MNTGTSAAAETTKQIVTLATGIIGLTVTFAEKFADDPDAALTVHWSLKGAWLALGLTVAFGVWTLMNITGVVNAAVKANVTPDADAPNIRLPALCMVLAFVTGMALVIWAGLDKFG